MNAFRSLLSWRWVLCALAFAAFALPQAAHAQSQFLVICKKTSPADPTAFGFTRSNPSGTLPGFSLVNGNCTKFDLTNQDHFNKVTETVPAGWTLTDIKCSGQAHSAVSIVGADPNALFQPGDTTVAVDLSDPVVTCTFTNTKSQGATGQIKICKVAGTGVNVNDPFAFNPGGVTVLAGPTPGGYCAIGPTGVVGSNMTITETLGAGISVTSITAAPPTSLVGSNLATGTATITVGSGVTEVTYTNERHTGWLEICKQSRATGDFTFTVPGVSGTITVPAGGCSPAMELPAGQVVIHENPRPGDPLVACATLPPGNLVSCALPAGNMTVTIVPGNLSTQTIALFTNR